MVGAIFFSSSGFIRTESMYKVKGDWDRIQMCKS